MNYPNGPYGQGFPQQPGPPQQPGYPPHSGFPQQAGYPQQPGYPPQPGFPQQQGFPPPGYPPQGGFQPQPYGMPSPEPSGATGIIAAVLAALGALSGLGGGAVGAFALAVTGSDAGLTGGVHALLIVSVLFSVVFGLMIAIGAVLLFQRKMLGRWLVVGACALAILSTLITFGVGITAEADVYGSYSGGAVFNLFGLVFPIATIVLAMLPPTTAWINAKPNSVAPQFYPPYQG
jgi:hypothetical protein